MKRLLALFLIICTLFVFASCDVILNKVDDIRLPFQDEEPKDTNDKTDRPDEPDDNQGNNGGSTTEPVKTKEDEWRETYNCITVSEGLDICDQTGETESSRYYVIATIVSIDDEDAYYGKMTVKDSTGQILVYGARDASGRVMYGDLDDKPVVGDVVLFYASFKNYKGTREIFSGYIIDYYTPDNGGNSGNSGNTGSTTAHTYNDFTSSEKALMQELIGTVIPFIPNDDYSLEEYDGAEYGYDGEYGVYFTTTDNTVAEFNAYLEKFSSYTLDGTEEDEDGDTWYYYSKGDVYIDVIHYYYDGDYYLELYAYIYDDGTGSGTGSGSGSGSTTSHTYNDFTSSEKALMQELIGTVIPFIPNDDYSLEEYDGAEYGYDGEYGVYFTTTDNTVAEFNAYLEKFSSYTLDGTEEDEDGDTWYYYSKGDVYIDVIHYYYDGDYYLELYAYIYDDGTGSGTGSGSGSGSGSNTNDGVITNEGAGLPNDADGVYDVDFTRAENVKDITDQDYYLGGCPTTGSPAVLVIPVDFSDVTASSKGYTTSAIVNAFKKNGVTDYYSVYDYYYISSYGQLTLDITVLDYWFRPQYTSSYYYNATYDYYGTEIEIGDQLVLDEALAYLATVMDLSRFDSDNNGMIDSVVLINTLEIGEEDFYWAYRYWNLYTDDDGYYYEYDGVSANDYMWASYQFLYEAYDDDGNTYYDSSVMNPYTFIHEFAHVLGVDDYYDTSYETDPLQGCDVMDSMVGDHNAYTKFNLGWITSSRLVVTDSSVTLTLKDFSKFGDTIIIGNNWDDDLGAYQEYYVLIYYKNTGLNAGDAGYFTRDGVVVYHVNASLYEGVDDGESYYYVYNNNTSPSDQYGTEDNLIEFVKSAADTYTYVEGDTLPTVTDDQGNTLGITFTVDSVTDEYVTITFTAA